MNKTALKCIDAMSGSLPMQFYYFNEEVKVSGEDALLSGHKKIKGKEINPEEDYLLTMPVKRSINHKLRMKRIYEKRGKIGLITYMEPLLKKEMFAKVEIFINKNVP